MTWPNGRPRTLASNFGTFNFRIKFDLDGWAVARKAREMNPEFPIIYMTGADAEKWPVNGVPNSILLNKPFAPAQLLTAVSQLLNAAPPTP